MKLKKGDKVIVITGNDKGKQGTITQVLRDEQKVVIDGINLKKKAIKSAKGQPSHFVDQPAPLTVSNVMIIDPKGGKPSRIGYTAGKDGKKIRITKKSKTEIK